MLAVPSNLPSIAPDSGGGYERHWCEDSAADTRNICFDKWFEYRREPTRQGLGVIVEERDKFCSDPRKSSLHRLHVPRLCPSNPHGRMTLSRMCMDHFPSRVVAVPAHHDDLGGPQILQPNSFQALVQVVLTQPRGHDN
jgi:hypothetical protein